MFPTLAYDPITFPRMSMFATDGRVDVTPVSWEPLPKKYEAVTLPSAAKRTFAILPADAMMFETLAYDPITFPRMSMFATDGRVDVTPVS